MCAAVAVLAAMSVVAGCSGGDDAADKKPPKSTGQQRPSRPVHDPPQKFATDAGTVMPEAATTGRLTGGVLDADLPVALHQQTAFVAAPDAVSMVDTVTGKTVHRITPQGTPLQDEAERLANTSPATAPLIMPDGESPAVITPFLVKAAGSGTQADHTVVEVVGSSAESARRLWSLPIHLPGWVKDTTSQLTAAVVGAHGDTVVVRVSDNDQAVSYGINSATHRLLWTKPGYRAMTVSGRTMVGVALEDDGTHQRAVGYDVPSGRRLWRGVDSSGVEVQGAGPHLVTAQGSEYDSGDSYAQFLDIRDGSVKGKLPRWSSQVCRYDAKDTVVCGGLGNPNWEARALDARTGKTLWQLPDRQADRIAPQVTAVWHGRLYGKTGHGAVVLDARTGKDVPAQAGAAPVLVNESVGLALDSKGDQLMAYPTSG
ncbi:PQQ-binding-like beta-propeller repeat protein [Streptomyces sp. NPDC048483]|uniref:outer membrane protein assembly factor BamB family protein n=1 Tax=Streptomyces sp. NPDC048483 TaxID=3154927 RepID=UPI0034138631